MPTIKLLGGTYRNNGTTYRPTDPPFAVSDAMAKKLNCSVVPEPMPPHDIESLREQALMLNIDYKKQWSADKLLKEIAAHGDADRG